MLDVQPEELATIKMILNTHVPGVSVWAFGSRVSGQHKKPHSDLDLALVADTPLPLAVLGMIEDAFAESDLPFRVDVVDWARANEAFRAIIRHTHEPVV